MEVYARELLSRALQIATKIREKKSLASLLEKLKSDMRALESQGVTMDKCAAMLFPLVESSLSEDLLKAWQRSAMIRDTVDLKDRLTKLMTFLQSEVEKERITMAVTGFTLTEEKKKSKKVKVKQD